MVNWDEGNGSSRRTPSHQEIADVSIAIKGADIEKSDAVNLVCWELGRRKVFRDTVRAGKSLVEVKT